MKTRPFRTGLGVALLLLGLTAAINCSDDEGTTPAATDSGGDVVLDIQIDQSPSEVVEETSRNCEPDTRQCADDRTALVCSADGEWEREPCGQGQRCWAGECGTENTCVAYEVQECVGCLTYQGCNPIGTGYGEFSVPFNQTCIEDEDGVAELVARVCYEGETMCEGRNVLMSCHQCGLDWEVATDCQEDDSTMLCDAGQCITQCQFIEKSQTYIGCEYWAVDLDNAYIPPYSVYDRELDAAGSQFAVALSNPDTVLIAEITIETIDDVILTGEVPPGDMVVFELPPANIEGTMRGYESYRVRSTMPVVAYQFNPLENEEVFSNDASLLIPTSSLGTEYYVMTREQTFDILKGSLTIVAVRDGTTEVTITLPEATNDNPLITLAGTDIPPLEGGDSYTITLNQYEVFNLETNRPGSDLTGAYVEALRPVVVFGGTEASNAPNTDACIYRESFGDWRCEWDRETDCWDDQQDMPTVTLCSNFITCCADHLEQQMIPIHAWGREFNAAHSWTRSNEPDVWRVMSGSNNTTVDLFGIPFEEGEPIRTNYTLNEGEWFEFQSRADFEIIASGPTFVGQFLVGLHTPGPDGPPADDDMNGDPAFIMSVPREQYRNDYIFLVPGEYAHNFTTIVVPTGTSVTHEDEVETTTIDADQFEAFGSGEYGALRYRLENEGYHRMTADLPFGVAVHGYDDDVSYGYPAGLDVENLWDRDE